MLPAGALAAVASLASAPLPATAQDALQSGFEGALRGCEARVLRPDGWASGPEAFLAEMGLGQSAGLVSRVDEHALPPETLREANHYWRINSASDSGFILVTSDRLPMCHITGGGQADLQPIVERVLGAPALADRWTAGEVERQGDMISTRYRGAEDPNFMIRVSRAREAGGRTDRVQLIATALYELDD